MKLFSDESRTEVPVKFIILATLIVLLVALFVKWGWFLLLMLVLVFHRKTSEPFEAFLAEGDGLPQFAANAPFRQHALAKRLVYGGGLPEALLALRDGLPRFAVNAPFRQHAQARLVGGGGPPAVVASPALPMEGAPPRFAVNAPARQSGAARAATDGFSPRQCGSCGN